MLLRDYFRRPDLTLAVLHMEDGSLSELREGVRIPRLRMYTTSAVDCLRLATVLYHTIGLRYLTSTFNKKVVRPDKQGKPRLVKRSYTVLHLIPQDVNRFRRLVAERLAPCTRYKTPPPYAVGTSLSLERRRLEAWSRQMQRARSYDWYDSCSPTPQRIPS